VSTAVLQDQLRRTLGRLEAALSSVEDALALTDFQGRVEWTNRAFNNLVGQPRLKCLGQSISQLLPSRYVDNHIESSECLLAWARNGPGRSVWDLSPLPPRKVIEVKWSPVNLNPDPSLVFVFRDLSEVSRAQDEVTRSRDNLEKEVASRTLELKQARDEALAATGAMSDFLSTISHEIRTPLNAIIGLSDLLLDSDLDDGQMELAQTIHRSGELLLRLINDILDLSKIEAKKLKLRMESFSIQALVSDCCRIMESSLAARGLELQLSIASDMPTELIGDSLRIHQILLNLMNNAIKFTDDGWVRVDVDWQPISQRKLLLLLTVEDSGRGISAEFLPRIFNRFSQEKQLLQGNSPQGTGLGLAICNRLCMLMGGSIRAESKLAKGSSFHVSLPMNFAGPDDATAEPTIQLASKVDLEPPRILVAEDNPINQRVLQLLLAKLDLHPEFVDDGQASIDRVRKGGIDLVLMDVQMPGVDGLEATRQLRLLDPRSPYIVALTAFAFGDHQRECLEAGMNDFLSKPVRLPDLQAALDRYQLWRVSSAASGQPRKVDQP
jgi:PAS domain S-box-containing protein